MTDLPLRSLVLYKHGLGFLTRRGTVEDGSLSLVFDAADVDDVLKSLVVVASGGGQVRSVRFRTRRDSALSVGRKHGFFDLLRELRGAPVILRLEGARAVEGRLLGIEEHPQGRKRGAMVVMATARGTVEQVASERITQLQVEDAQVGADLDRVLDAGPRGARALAVELDAPGREVEVSYAAPCPVWRVSYRLVATGGGAPHCLLQAWAVIDNCLDEDLDDVEVTLVAGQPVSFRYDLTSSVIPERRLLRDLSRLPAGPVELEAPLGRMAPALSAAPAMAHRFAHARAPEPWGLEESIELVTETQDLAELFEYRLGAVSVRAGESAMIPIAQHRAPYRRELLYNGTKHPRHPVVTLRFENATGLTLERGPATIVEEGRYRGDAILPFTRSSAEIALAYAVELGIAVRERTEVADAIAAIDLTESYLHIQEYRDQRTTYTLASSLPEEQVVTIERLKQAELAETRSPDEETLEHRRWRVTCPPGIETAFQVVERTLLARHEAVLDVDLDQLAGYLEHRFLDAETRRRLRELLRLRQSLAALERKSDALQAELAELRERQKTLRENLQIDARTPQEEEIRRRSADLFGRVQDREEEIERELAQLANERPEIEAALEGELVALA